MTVGPRLWKRWFQSDRLVQSGDICFFISGAVCFFVEVFKRVGIQG